MPQNSKSNRLVRNWVIFVDFILLNVLFLVYIHTDFVCHTLIGKSQPSALLMVANLAFAIAQYFFSNVVHRHRTTSDQILRQVSSLVLVYLFSAYLLTRFMARYEGVPSPSYLFTVWFSLGLYVALIITRYVEKWVISSYRRKGYNVKHVVLVGSDPILLPLYKYFSEDPSKGYVVNGYYADTQFENCPIGLVYKGTMADLDNVMKTTLTAGTADELYCSLNVGDKERMLRIMKYCNNNVIHFYYVPTFSNIFGRSFIQEQVGETTVFTNYGEPLMMPTNKLLKRGFDVFFSSIVCVCMVPFLPIIAAIIKIQSPGPVFFKQARTGLNGRNFYCYKFRSMHVNKDADLVQATENDPRKFAFGNFMRKSNIDELPQFFNVLKGDMSIVGPRPHMLHHTEVYRELIDKYMVRHFVKPGITGWAQVTGFRGETKELWQMEGRVKRDIWYIENWTIWLDIRICWKTFKQMIVHDKNAY